MQHGSKGRKEKRLLYLTHGSKLQPYEARQGAKTLVIRKSNHAIRLGFFDPIPRGNSNLHNCSPGNTVTSNQLYIFLSAVFKLRQREVELRVAIVLPHMYSLDCVYDGGMVVDDANSSRRRVYFARAVCEQVAGQIGKTIRGVSECLQARF